MNTSDSPDTARNRTRTISTGRAAQRSRTIATVAAVVAVVASVLFPFAPVQREDVTYRWDAASDGPAAAIPMLPYQPLRAVAEIDCAAAAARGVLLATTPPNPDPGAEPISALRVASDGGPAPTVTVTVGAAPVGSFRPPPGCASVTVTSTVEATTVAVDGTEVARADGDVRPAVAGAFAGPGARGASLEVVGDTRFQTSITALKALLGALAVAAVAVVVFCLARLDRARRGPPGAAPPRPPIGVLPGSPLATFGAPRPPPGRRLTDAGVLAGLALWQVVGPMTVDDGYIAGIVRARFTNGQVGTVYRWLNSPEAPFGWFYDVLAGIASLDPAPFWLRLPSTVLGVVAWFLLTRAVLPRLRIPSPAPTRPGSRSASLRARARTLPVGLVFLAWWLPFDLGVRPEPWVVVGATLVLVLTERAIARRAVAPLAGALVLAGWTLAVTPTGIVAFAPFLAAVLPLARLVRARRGDLGTVLPAVAAVAALGVTLPLVYADQTWASVLDSVGIRTLIGGDRPWTDEYARYATLLTAGDAEGNLGRRAPVLLLLVALAVLALRPMRGLARGPSRRLVTTTVLSLAALALTPTKWTHHFGAFAVLGTGVTLLALHAWTRPAPAHGVATARRAALGTAVAAIAGGLTLAGYNQWHWLSSYAVTWSTIAPQLGGVRFADALLAVGAVLAIGCAVVAVRRAVSPGWRGPSDARLLRIAPVIAVGVVVLVVAVEVLSLTRTSVQRRDSYTLASDSLASLTGRSCGVADRLRVEADPRAGLLRAAAVSLPGPAVPLSGPGVAPVAPERFPASVAAPTAAGAGLPGWYGPDVTGDWVALPTPDAASQPDPGQRIDRDLPLVVTLTGPVLEPGRLALEVADTATGGVTRLPLDEASTQYSASASVLAPGPRDLRVDRASLPATGAVRVVSGPRTPADQGFSVPRTPVTVPWSTVLAPGVPAAVDWPAEFLFPCTPLPPLRDGLAPLPGWRVSTDLRSQVQSGYISYTATQGGPWTTTRSLVRQETLPVYLPGLPMTDVASLERWVPVTPTGRGPRVQRERVTESGLATPGPLSVGRG